MVKQASILSELGSIVGSEHIAGGGEAKACAVDEFAPQAVVRPGTYQEVAEVLRWASATGSAVIPRGGGTMIALGNAPSKYDIALCLSRLDRVTEHEPADLTLTCQAGVTLASLRERAAAAGQFVPFDPTLPGAATAGGALAANASGPWRHAYGTARDFTIGLRVVTVDGRVTRAGGKVVKNVAGYDLCKLYIGSLGTLGVIVEATFKVRPLPAAEQTIALAFAGPAPACRLATEAHRRGLSAVAIRLTNPLAEGGGWMLVTHLAGTPHAVARSQREVEALAAELQGKSTDLDASPRTKVRGSEPRSLGLQSEGLSANTTAIRAAVLPSQVAAVAQQLEAGARLEAYPTSGVITARWQAGADDLARIVTIQRAVAAAGGTVVVESCPPGVKSELDVFGPLPTAFPLMRAVKQQFDPNGVLAPGRFVGRL